VGKSNPLRTENNPVIIKHVTYAYKQFLLCFGRHSNFWHEYARYLEEQIKTLNEKEAELIKKLVKEEATLYERATKGLMRHNLLLHFAFADFEEIRNDKKKALDVYNNLIDIGQQDERIDLTLVYIQLMRFTRRTEGLRSARAVFKMAHYDKRCTYDIYTATALMDYHCTKDQAIACKISELGLRALCLRVWVREPGIPLGRRASRRDTPTQSSCPLSVPERRIRTCAGWARENRPLDELTSLPSSISHSAHPPCPTL